MTLRDYILRSDEYPIEVVARDWFSSAVRMGTRAKVVYADSTDCTIEWEDGQQCIVSTDGPTVSAFDVIHPVQS